MAFRAFWPDVHDVSNVVAGVPAKSDPPFYLDVETAKCLLVEARRHNPHPETFYVPHDVGEQTLPALEEGHVSGFVNGWAPRTALKPS